MHPIIFPLLVNTSYCVNRTFFSSSKAFFPLLCIEGQWFKAKNIQPLIKKEKCKSKQILSKQREKSHVRNREGFTEAVHVKKELRTCLGFNISPLNYFCSIFALHKLTNTAVLYLQCSSSAFRNLNLGILCQHR